MHLRNPGGWLAAVAILGALGCRGDTSETAPERPFRDLTLGVGAVGTPSLLKLVSAQAGDWAEAHGARAVAERSVDPGEARSLDVILFPGERMGDLIDAGALAVLPERVVAPAPVAGPAAAPEEGTPEPPRDSLAFSEILPAYRDDVTKYGNARMALPLGGSALVLAYRRDALRARASGKPPETWEELDAWARDLASEEDGGGIALPLGDAAEGLGAAVFLARAAALGQHRDQYSFLFDADTMEPRIDSPPFVEALERLVALKATGHDAEAAREAFRSGAAALLIDRAEAVAAWVGKEARGAIDVARLPGSRRVYDPTRQDWEEASPPNRPSYLTHGGGWLVGVAAGAEGLRREAAIDFARDLAGSESSGRLGIEGVVPMLPVRGSALLGVASLPAARGVDGRSWARAVAGTLEAERVVPGLRIPGAEGYLADLGRAVAAAAAGTPPAEALRAAARHWARRTEDLGKARQLWHYRRSLNRLATDPEPPAR